MVNRLDELDLAEVARTVDLGTPACLAKPVFVHRAHQVVIDAATYRITVRFVNVEGVYDLDCHSVHIIAAEDGKREPVDLVKRNVGIFKRVLHFY